jgi:O-antigen ligase
MASATVPATQGSGRLLWLGLVLSVLTIALALIAQGNVAAALAPTLLVCLAWLMWRIPVRYSLYGLIYLGLVLECPQEIPANGMWHSPLWRLGEILLSKCNDWTHIKPLVFTGVDVVVGYLLLILIWRRATGSRIDVEGQDRTAGAMALGATITLAGTLWVWLYGLARGGNFGASLLQIYKLLYIPLLFFLCQAAFRGPKDHLAIVRLVLAAVITRSLLCLFVRYVIAPTMPHEMSYATTHGDSMLFASGVALCIALANEGFARRSWSIRILLFTCLGLFIWAAKANNRRVVWVEMTAVVVAFWLISGWTPLKRFVVRTVTIGLPLIALYFAVGWNSNGRIFTPVRLARSILDSKSDPSTLWRDLENADLVLNIREHPIFGTGLGHEYEEQIKLPDVSAAFKLYRYIPHNSVLGFLAFAGVFGFSLLWCAIAVAVFLSARAYNHARAPLDRALALWCIAIMIVYINSIYGDMGQGSWTAVFLVCPALAIAGKLVVSVGGWPRRAPRTLSVPRTSSVP